MGWVPHQIEIFAGNCHLCRQTIEIVTIGKCKDCILEVMRVDSPDEGIRRKVETYGINAVPTIVVDSKVKVVGLPKFPWFCGEDFYRFLEQNYPLMVTLDTTKEPTRDI